MVLLYLRRSLIAVVSLLGVVLLAEALLRWTEDGRPWKRKYLQDGALIRQSAYVFDARFSERFSPGWTGRAYYLRSSEFVRLRINSYGFRFPEYPKAS